MFPPQIPGLRQRLMYQRPVDRHLDKTIPVFEMIEIGHRASAKQGEREAEGLGIGSKQQITNNQ